VVEGVHDPLVGGVAATVAEAHEVERRRCRELEACIARNHGIPSESPGFAERSPRTLGSQPPMLGDKEERRAIVATMAPEKQGKDRKGLVTCLESVVLAVFFSWC
jgi:hypothetical protein